MPGSLENQRFLQKQSRLDRLDLGGFVVETTELESVTSRV